MDPDILGYYNQGREQGRLTSIGRLEYLRTQEILHRHLLAPPARVVDVGGGAGIHAVPLIGEGFDVTLVDPVALHVDQARRAGVIRATVGDALALPLDDGTVDAALLLGPLYHLTQAEDRQRALAEALRVTRPGGVLVAACISRFASTFDGLGLHYLDDPAFEAIVEDDVATGQHRNPTGRSGWFTTAYLHHPADIAGEVAGAGWDVAAVIAVEGPGATADAAYWLGDPDRQATLLRSIERVESEPSLLGSSPHLVAVARHP
jgi:SAM-dependent methyltransferase